MQRVGKKHALVVAAVGGIVGITVPLILLYRHKPDAVAAPLPEIIHQSVAQPANQPQPAPPAAKTSAPTVTSTPTPKPSVKPSPLAHASIVTTVFWVGEDASADNAGIHNYSSAWNSDWVAAFGGVDDPTRRNGYLPAFTPKENPFYFALPYGDYTEAGLKANINRISWYQPVKPPVSLLKNRWIKISWNSKTVYGQWQDVGPYESDDINYVFGSSKPINKVGLDVSPAMQDYLGFKGMATTSWQFIDEAQVPDGPWKTIVTRSNPSW
jgi:hypothetical protein